MEQKKLLLTGKTLADPNFDTPGSINILIGAELYRHILLGNKMSLGKDLPIALDTIFGFVVIGQAPSMSMTTDSPLAHIYTSMLCMYDLDLHNSMQKFWINEEPPHFLKLSKEEEQCEEYFKESHYRDTTGRCVVRLPFKERKALTLWEILQHVH